MKQLLVEKNTKITLNDHVFVLEPGDKVVLEGYDDDIAAMFPGAGLEPGGEEIVDNEFEDRSGDEEDIEDEEVEGEDERDALNRTWGEHEEESGEHTTSEIDAPEDDTREDMSDRLNSMLYNSGLDDAGFRAIVKGIDDLSSDEQSVLQVKLSNNNFSPTGNLSVDNALKFFKEQQTQSRRLYSDEAKKAEASAALKVGDNQDKPTEEQKSAIDKMDSDGRRRRKRRRQVKQKTTPVSGDIKDVDNMIDNILD